MTIRKILYIVLVVLGFLLTIAPVHAQSESPVKVIYQESFSSDPGWITNNPSTNYLDANMGMYHFSIEPSTQCYVYKVVKGYNGGPFTLEYDVLLHRVDDAQTGATFRLGFSGAEMDRTKGPNVLTEFTNAKYGKIMWLRLVTPGSKLVETNSQSAATELGPTAYSGPTAKYDFNKTYHVKVDYDDDHKTLSMKVTEQVTGNQIWNYYLNTLENLKGMDRIYMGSKGDYGAMNIYAQGYLDNVKLTVPDTAVVTTPTGISTPSGTPIPTITTKKLTPKQTLSLPTPYPTDTPQSPSSGILAIAAFGIIGVCSALTGIRKN
jgi:hypothetical protein